MRWGFEHFLIPRTLCEMIASFIAENFQPDHDAAYKNVTGKLSDMRGDRRRRLAVSCTISMLFPSFFFKPNFYCFRTMLWPR